VVQDLTHGTGWFNVSLGAITAACGVGAALSNILAGWIVVAVGYDVAFMSRALLAGAGLALYLTAMPETGPHAAAIGRPDADAENGVTNPSQRDRASDSGT
jgi:hypothetical protein